jgi:hypothetical protein
MRISRRVSYRRYSALRGMIAEFIFFLSIAAICFSGLLFTLWRLCTSGSPSRTDVEE